MLGRVRLFATPWTIARQAPLCMGILQARIMEWIAMPSSRGSSQPRDRTQVSPTFLMDSLPSEPPGQPKNTGVGSLSLSPEDLSDPGIELGSPTLQVDSLPPAKSHMLKTLHMLCLWI